MRLKILGNRVAVRHDYELKSKGGIDLPDCAQIKKLGSFVVSVGDGDKIHPDIKPGTQVVTNPFGGQDVMWNGEQLKIINSEDVWALILETGKPILSVVGADK